LGALSDHEMEAMADLGPEYRVENWRKIVVGKAYPTFKLDPN
jgi:hypothetical protein